MVRAINAFLPYLLLAVLVWSAWAIYVTARELWRWAKTGRVDRSLSRSWRAPETDRKES